MLSGARHAIDEQHQPGGDRRRTSEVEVTIGQVGAALTQKPGADSDYGSTDRHVDVEDPGPAERTGQNAAEQHAHSATAACHGAPDPERAIPLAAFVEGCRQDRQRRGRHHRGAETLQAPERDQRAFRPGKPVEQRTDGEHEQPRHEQAPASEQIREPSTEQEKPAEEDRVGGDHPLQALLGEVQIGLDRRQCHVHDRNVEYDHELRRHDHSESEPVTAVLRRDCGMCHNFSGHPSSSFAACEPQRARDGPCVFESLVLR